MTAGGLISDLRQVVTDGERIYAQRYKSKYEQRFPDQFAAIDVQSGRAFVAEFPENAIEQARSTLKNPVLHLVRIGSPSAYQVSFFLASDDADLARVL